MRATKPTNARDRRRFAALSAGQRGAAQDLVEDLYDGTRTVAACWTRALSIMDADGIAARARAYRDAHPVAPGEAKTPQPGTLGADLAEADALDEAAVMAEYDRLMNERDAS